MSLRDSDLYKEQVQKTQHNTVKAKSDLVNLIIDGLYSKATNNFHTFCRDLTIKNSHNSRSRFIYKGTSFPLIALPFPTQSSPLSHIPCVLHDQYEDEFLNEYSQFQEINKESALVLNYLATLIQESDCYLDFIKLMPPFYSNSLSSTYYKNALQAPPMSDEELDNLRARYSTCIDLIHNRMTINLLTGN